MSSRGMPVTKAIRAFRRKEAEARAAERAKRSPAEQIAKLDLKLGAGVGAKKERARLVAQMEEVESTDSSEKKKISKKNNKTSKK